MGLDKSATQLINKISNKMDNIDSVLTYGVQNMRGNYKSQYEFFRKIGYSVIESVDISESENPTYVRDLNYDITIDKKYDLIVDGGTMEHCFHVPYVLSNTIKLLKKDGYVIHLNPLNNWINHSFYQFSPTLYYDFYKENNFTDLNMWLLLGKINNREVIKVDNNHIYDKIHTSKPTLVLFSGKKQEDIDYIRYPIQGKYRKWK